MPLFKFVVCGNRNAVATDADQEKYSRRGFVCGNNFAVARSAHEPLNEDALIDIMASSGGANVEEKDQKENTEMDKLIHLIETEQIHDASNVDSTASETVEEEEEEIFEEEIDEAETLIFSNLLGETLKTNYSDDPINTDDALYGSAVVALYFAGDKETTKKLTIFDAGYEYKSLDIVYCSPDNEGFAEAPKRWWALADSETYQKLVQNLDIDGPSLVVLDPQTGSVLSESSALDDIRALDPQSETYNQDTEGIMSEWISSVPLEQAIMGEMDIELEQ